MLQHAAIQCSKSNERLGRKRPRPPSKNNTFHLPIYRTAQVRPCIHAPLRQSPWLRPQNEKARNLAISGFLIIGRRGGIRTRDPLHPMQVRYQAALHADKPQIIASNLIHLDRVCKKLANFKQLAAHIVQQAVRPTFSNKTKFCQQWVRF